MLLFVCSNQDRIDIFSRMAFVVMVLLFFGVSVGVVVEEIMFMAVLEKIPNETIREDIFS